jgi:hypothetical protein
MIPTAFQSFFIELTENNDEMAIFDYQWMFAIVNSGEPKYSKHFLKINLNVN